MSHDPSRGPWKGFGALAGMAHQHNGHQGAFPCPQCAGFEWSPDTDVGVLVYEGTRLVETSALIQRVRFNGEQRVVTSRFGA